MYSVCELKTRKSSALPLQPWFPTSGGLTRVAGRKRPQLQLRYQTHGGLTPAALDCVCSPVIEHIRFARRSVHRTTAG
jgi:hypothetical protein